MAKLRMGIYRICQRLTVGGAPDSPRKPPGLAGVNVAGTPWTLVVMDWYSRSVSRSATSLAACVSPLIESNDC